MKPIEKQQGNRYAKKKSRPSCAKASGCPHAGTFAMMQHNEKKKKEDEMNNAEK
ncbi:predicted protein [Pyrenophora tritici-repentis Pt-1C-BFP]|uniref:Uncharacterized protein n=1 Tax=Pyrenophora tritici-repentis (strain Pt-1C-BFP) TaxID=426418 RepID=B2VYD0_PYRTR|nr:uncharacterized protein PTRG_02420 [Pyrenophora tritici-repentis Pt-1C-BFP]EDU44943.1 predicted protein [Pyrenophora tritici-repentis Pt-1C-BFP]